MIRRPVYPYPRLNNREFLSFSKHNTMEEYLPVRQCPQGIRMEAKEGEWKVDLSHPFPRLNRPMNGFFSPTPVRVRYNVQRSGASRGNDDGWISLEARAVDTILHFAWVLENHVHAELSQKTDSDDSRILIRSPPPPIHPPYAFLRYEHCTVDAVC